MWADISEIHPVLHHYPIVKQDTHLETAKFIISNISAIYEYIHPLILREKNIS